MAEQIPEIALDWFRAGRGAAVATVIETWGSAPRAVGSQLVVDASGAMEGSVSGGCVEGAVILEAIEAIADGQLRVLEFGVSDDEAFAVGLACGGRIRILVEPVGAGLGLDMLAELVAARADRRAIGYRVNIASFERAQIDINGDTASALEGDLFTLAFHPPLRMIIVGAVHIAQHLCPMAQACGWDPVLVDPRPVFGAEDRFPGFTIRDDWPDEALRDLGLDGSTAVVTLTHDPKLDLPAITETLKARVLYLGCLGSTRTHAKRVAALEQDGFRADDIARIHAPVGLNIGARSPAEIAVSIMAEITQSLRKS